MKTLDEILVHFAKQLAVAQGINNGGAKGEAQLYAENQQSKTKVQILQWFEQRIPKKKETPIKVNNYAREHGYNHAIDDMKKTLRSQDE